MTLGRCPLSIFCSRGTSPSITKKKRKGNEQEERGNLAHLLGTEAFQPFTGGGGLRRIVKRFRAGLVCKARRLLYHSSPGSRVIKTKKEGGGTLGTYSNKKPSMMLSTDRQRLGSTCFRLRV